MKRAHIPAAIVVLIVGLIGVLFLRERVIAPEHGRFALRGAPRTTPPASAAVARNLVLVTIDTLRADHVGVYGYPAGTTPALDRIARAGVRFEHALAPAPITLTSHASMLTGRYPPGHGARHNGMRLEAGLSTLGTILRRDGFQTAAFVAAFPLDRRFGLSEGFDVYSDRMPRDASGKVLNERPAREVVDEAIAWLATHRTEPFFLWVHLFEPHAPYGDPAHAAERPAIERYDEEIRTADAQVGRLLGALGPAAADSLVIAVGDHGEAFGEHGEFTHSVFVYDTTLRVPWVMSGPGVPASGVMLPEPVCLVDLAPTALALLGKGAIDSDGVDLRPLLAGGRLPAREIYAESFAPLFDFGWSPLRSVRKGRWKAVAAPRPELYDTERDPGEIRDQAAEQAATVRTLVERADVYARTDTGGQAAAPATGDPEAARRLGALGYIHGSAAGGARPGDRPDPKDRRELAARIGQVFSGELHGAALKAALEAILRDDPRNPQARLRLGDVLVAEGQFAAAAPHFRAAIDAQVPSIDAYLGLAACQVAGRDARAAERTLAAALAREPGNPVAAANLGILQMNGGRLDAAIASLNRALAADPDLHEARFNLALAYADSGHRAEADRQVRELLVRLPAAAPQRAEVERLAAALRR